MCCFKILKISVPIRGGTATVDEQVGTADEAATRRHQELGQIAHLVRRSCTTGWHALNHLQVAFFARTVQFVVGQWGDDDATAQKQRQQDAGCPPCFQDRT